MGRHNTYGFAANLHSQFGYQDVSLLSSSMMSGPSQHLGEGSVRQRRAGVQYGTSRVSQYTERRLTRYSAIANSLHQARTAGPL